MITNKPQTAGVKVSVHDLGPRKRLRLPKGSHVLVVEDGVLLVTYRDDQLALIRGDEVVVRSGEFEARNATGGRARVLALSRA
jgi:sulfur transfer complex TusBCD TusB component (DsrH family)